MYSEKIMLKNFIIAFVNKENFVTFLQKIICLLKNHKTSNYFAVQKKKGWITCTAMSKILDQV